MFTHILCSISFVMTWHCSMNGRDIYLRVIHIQHTHIKKTALKEEWSKWILVLLQHKGRVKVWTRLQFPSNSMIIDIWTLLCQAFMGFN